MRNIFIFSLLLFSTSSYACECIGLNSFEEHVDSADIIFYATVVSINDGNYTAHKDMLNMHFDPENYPENYGYKPTFKIIEVFKGEFKTPLIDNSYEYKSQWSNCDRIFKKGYSYIVFANFQENGEINTSICTLGGIVKDNDYFTKLRSALSAADKRG